ncbi:Nitrilase/cyanide hydratase and apolipoprotein N-acyltransferase [Beauveria brongniartii RCEF 3172]|uniref:Nitrilase/cyanide hydratase and apolipoprotein N-acyltransferase n=1 Tax=Beauveria brongniartii RCEF 3172 TaxID=1081107 RepID=A0A167GCE9_9HYPO|nr:Nitrilase/cyanide hydratase and apolipoprotein N-acyltransferase [Beauveria brongniartii RCEF 3172]
MSKLKVALIQLYSKSLDVEGNYAKAESFIRSAAAQGAQLAVLPEYHVQGWVGDRAALLRCAQQSPAILARYQALARELRLCIVPGTLLEDLSHPSDAADEPPLANVAYFLGPDGAVCGRYHKRNLWHPEKPLLRAPAAAAAPHHIAFDTPLGVRAGMLICWDLSFPEAFRALAADGARLIVVPSFWVARDVDEPVNAVNPHAERLFLDTMCVARAFENSCAIVYVNCGGAPAAEEEDGVAEGYDKEGREHAGVSQAAMPMLGAVGRLGHGKEDMSVVELDLDLLEVAEKAYRPRDDMERRGWKYDADVSGIWRMQEL